jgi:cell division protease FtsH
VTQHKNVSNETARKIDEVVREILDTAYGRTRKLLMDNIDKLHVMADALLQYETIDARQIDDIMAGRVPGPPDDWGKSPAPGGSTPPPPPPRGDAGAKVGDPATQSHI